MRHWWVLHATQTRAAPDLLHWAHERSLGMLAMTTGRARGMCRNGGAFELVSERGDFCPGLDGLLFIRLASASLCVAWEPCSAEL